MASPMVLARLRKKLEEYEGKINHMYIDSEGYVTIGVGHLITNVTSAQNLTLYTTKGKKATKPEIKLDFDTVNKQIKNKLASYYKQFTKLTMKDVDIEKQLDKHIVSFEKELKRVYSGFSALPEDVKLALFDMIFNLGQRNLKAYKNMNAAIAKSDWLIAAKESNRPKGTARRNKYVSDLFIKADNAKVNKKTMP